MGLEKETSMERRRPDPGPVYAIADVELLGLERLASAVRAMAEAGISWIQIRAKTGSPASTADRALFYAVEACFEALEEAGVEGGAEDAALWMDDRADLAALFPFAGLHLGRRDLPPRAARRVVGETLWIGASTHDENQLAEAADDPEVDVVAVGPVFPTTGKASPDPVVGLELVRRARAATGKTLVAIGGIGAENLGDVLAAGADTAAVLGAVCRGDVAANARRLMAAAEAAR
jgi:thiamine-phosphate pyrophosphorylase